MFPARVFLAASSLFFAAAICLHHDFNFASLVRDAVIYPVALLVTAALRKNRRWLYVAAAIVIALPSLAFLNPRSLANPAELTPFLNQLFLLLTALFAVAGVGIGFLRKHGK